MTTIRITRRHDLDNPLTLGDLREIVADADRRKINADAEVIVNAQHRWVSGVNADGSPSAPYPEGHGGHYVTRVAIRGTVPNRAEEPCPE
ncbi:hypothetical protein SEA_KOZIE_12 [Microbacterium phage Kozie]|uniref:Uncharacterized protein n=1 Tax=Microbacterium phage Kozie TaxID=2885981 RepID=A0AAE8Y855_9CAUD|nr:hypothetical protein QC998_gp12 [Microbacterium phage Kozie]UDL16208.1 hypothetical protein SEA_KOZIE_12 [Microbacterium phage Kozie]